MKAWMVYLTAFLVTLVVFYIYGHWHIYFPQEGTVTHYLDASTLECPTCWRMFTSNQWENAGKPMLEDSVTNPVFEQFGGKTISSGLMVCSQECARRPDGVTFRQTEIGDYEVWKDGEVVSIVSEPWMYDVPKIDYVGMPINLTGLAPDGSPAMTVGYSDGKGGYTMEDPTTEEQR